MTENRSSEKTFYSLDLDRFILNTELATDYYIDIVTRHNPSVGKLAAEALKASEDSGHSFDVRSFVAGLISPDDLKKIDDDYSEYVKDIDLLNDGARDLLEYTAGYARGVLTYGNPETQLRKMADAGILGEVPYLVTPNPAKGEEFSSWKMPDGRYSVPIGRFVVPLVQTATDRPSSIIVDRVVHGDDKPASFDGKPDDMEGYLYRDPSKVVLPSQTGEAPSGVVEVASLKDIVRIEKERNAS